MLEQDQEVITAIDENRIERTLTIREKLIDLLQEEGVPTDKADKTMLIQLLDGMDRTVLAKSKLKSDAKSNKEQTEMTRLVAEVLTKTRLDANRRRDMPVELDHDQDIDDLVEGELAIGNVDITYDQFMS